MTKDISSLINVDITHPVKVKKNKRTVASLYQDFGLVWYQILQLSKRDHMICQVKFSCSQEQSWTCTNRNNKAVQRDLLMKPRKE